MAASLANVAQAADDLMLTPPPFSEIELSPDGATLAAFENNGPDLRKVMLVDTESSKTNRFSIGDGKGGQAEVTSIDWIGSNYLAICSKGDGNVIRLHTAHIGDRSPKRRSAEGKTSFLRAIDGSTRFVVSEQVEEGDSQTCRLLEYDAASEDDPKVLYTCKSKTFECRLDSNGALRMLKRDDGDGANTAWYAIDPTTGEERKLHAIQEWIKVHGMVGDTEEAIVAGHINTQYPSLYVYDTKTDTVGKILVDHDQLSVEHYAHTVFDPRTGNVIGLHLDLYERSSYWFDPLFAKRQDAVDALLPGTRNRIVDWSDDKNQLLVERFIPNLPTQYLYLDIAKNSVSPMLLNGPSAKPQDTGNTQLIKIPNRSGEELTAVLTLPPGKPSGKMPLLIWLRSGIWQDLERPEWHPEANFFATAGFVVLRINYTGSQGLLGKTKGDPSSKEGILTLFSDVEDSVKTLVDAGLVDPQKVCIGGGGLSGWASAYAPIASPGLYQAVISMNGLYNLVEYREASKGNNQMNGGLYLDFANAGSSLSDADILALSIPQNLGTYAKSVFMTTGKWSTQEYKNHNSDFAKALKKAKVPTKVYSDDWWGPQMNAFQRIEAFKRALSVLKAATK